LKSNRFKFLLLAGIASTSCGKSSDKKDTTPVEVVPNVCKSLAIMGTFPINGQPNQDTYGIACFEGYLMQFEKKRYLADSKCGDARLQVASGDEKAKKYYEPLESKSCPVADTIAVCDMKTAKAFVYKGSEEFFEKDAFNAYCKENSGTVSYN
jgi:hypothetical protein